MIVHTNILYSIVSTICSVYSKATKSQSRISVNIQMKITIFSDLSV